jgi:lysophospholipid acyltransferase
MVVTRSRYYTAWKLGQGSIDFCGLGYTVKTNEEGKEDISFDKIDVCNLTVMEWSINPRIRIQYWNRSVHLWLKHYLFLRLINTNNFSKRKGIASLLTFAVSAIWHGFYPCYYLFFLHYFLIEQVSTFFEDDYDLFNYFEKKGGVFRFAFLQFIAIMLQYYGQTFTILSLKGVFDYYAAFYYLPNLILLALYVYITFVHKKKRKAEAKDILVSDKNK